MKNIKLMLTVIIVSATVGGALAIKLNKMHEFCTAPPKEDGTCGTGTAQDPYQLCAGVIFDHKTTASGGVVKCVTVPNLTGTPCPSTKQCASLTRITED